MCIDPSEIQIKRYLIASLYRHAVCKEEEKKKKIMMASCVKHLCILLFIFVSVNDIEYVWIGYLSGKTITLVCLVNNIASSSLDISTVFKLNIYQRERKKKANLWHVLLLCSTGNHVFIQRFVLRMHVCRQLHHIRRNS